MSLHRINAKRDTAEAGIIAALEAGGCTVQQISAKDVPDLLIGRRGSTLVAEVKTGKARLSDGQSQWWDRWRGNERIVLRTVDDALALLRRWRVNHLDSDANAA